MRFLNSVTVPKNENRGPWGFFDIHCVSKYRNKRRGDPLVESKKIQKQSKKWYESCDICGHLTMLNSEKLRSTSAPAG